MKEVSKVCFYENFGGFWVYQEPEIEAKMREIENKYNCMVYAITHEFTEWKMGTSNFLYQKDFYLYAADFTDIDEDGETFFDEYAYENALAKIDEVNSTLRFYRVQLKSGYYEGTQIVIEETDEYCDEFYLQSSYYDFREYGVNRYILRRMIHAERKRINEKILPLFKAYGFAKYEISARFSNGENGYSVR